MWPFLRRCFWDRSAFVLAVCVLVGLVAGWGLPDTESTVEALAFGQILMAIIVAIKEGLAIANEKEADHESRP
jgi:hypothetical protein